MTIINLILIEITTCFIIDCSGFINSIKRQYLRKIFKIKNPDISNLNWKPFDCSLCMTFWLGIIYLLITSNFTLFNFAILSILSLMSSNVSGLLLTIKDFLSSFEMWLEKLIK